MSNGYTAVVTDPSVQSAAYFFGAIVSEEVVNSAEFHNLSKITRTIGRLLNDIVTTEVNCLLGKHKTLTNYKQ